MTPPSPSDVPPAVELAELQPSQLYVSAEKLRRVRERVARDGVGWLGPLPVRRLSGAIVLTDGHTRALAAHQAGRSSIPVYVDSDDLDRAAYETCVGWCRDEGVIAVPDLASRVLAAHDYEEKWLERCRRLHRETDGRRKGRSQP